MLRKTLVPGLVMILMLLVSSSPREASAQVVLCDVTCVNNTVTCQTSRMFNCGPCMLLIWDPALNILAEFAWEGSVLDITRCYTSSGALVSSSSSVSWAPCGLCHSGQ